MTTLTLSGPQAGLLFSALIAFSDDQLSDQEGVVMRKYYRYRDAADLEEVLHKAGFEYPRDLEILKPHIITALKEAGREYAVRAVAVGLKLAASDGSFDRQEMALLQHFARDLDIPLGEAEDYARTALREVDDGTDYLSGAAFSPAMEIGLGLKDAALALCTLVAFSDDDPSEAEAAVLRDFFTEEEVLSVQKKFTDAGMTYPDDLPTVKADILSAFLDAGRSLQLKYLAVAYKTALADGRAEAEELALIKEFCEELYIGIKELKDYFTAVP
ncbi:MAG: TerB family tellurite resistance protein [Spirochaetales bacterium]|nr:TerB family tellurite resistance protein [Spirochaetales bacterium]